MPSLPRWLHRQVETVAAHRRTMTIADIRMEAVAKWSGRAALLVGLFAFAISFMQIKWVAEELGTSPRWLSWLFPMLIDLPSLVASSLTVALHNRRYRVRLYAWLVLTFFSLASWACNGVHALSTLAEGNNRFVVLIADLTGVDQHSGWLIALVLAFAAIPPIGIVLGVHLWAYALRHSVGADQRADGKALKTGGKQKTEKTDPGTADRSGQQQTAPGTKTVPDDGEKTAPPGETAPGRHTAPPVEETAPAAGTGPKRSGPKRSGGPARTLIGFTWKTPNDQFKDKDAWKLDAREIVRSTWETDPGAVNAAEINRELGNPVTGGTMRKLVAPTIAELEAWPHFTMDGEVDDAMDSGLDIRRELHAADPPAAEDDSTRVDDRRHVGVA